MFDLVIRGGTVIDGTGSSRALADVGIARGRIAAVGALSEAASPDEIDATGRVVAPGFVDIHSHSDLVAFLPSEPIGLASVRQGVTTEVTGNCGWTPYPSPPDHLREAFHQHLSSVFGPATHTFASVADYRHRNEDLLLPVNLAPLVGHGSIRATVMGLGNATPTDEDQRRMTSALEQALDEGAFGLSSGLVYPPGMYSGPEEIVPLAAAVRRYGRLYATHVRNETDGVLDAISEGIDVARRAGTRLQLSHVKVASRERWGTMDAVLERIDRAVMDGLDVRGDAYPYTAGSTLLRALLPPWVNDGGVAMALERLRTPEVRRRVAEEIRTGLPDWQNLAAAAGWDGTVIATAAKIPEVEGRSIADLAEASRSSPVDTIADLLLATGGEVLIVLHMMAEQDVADALASPHVLIGSDTIPVPGASHPRSAGTFARMLHQAVGSSHPTALPDAIRHMTSLPAERLGLARRGQIRDGYVADLVVFDAATVADRADYAHPLMPPVGIDDVLVCGEPVIRQGRDTGRRPGRVLEPTA